MLKRLNINWNARQLVKMCMNGSITFDNAIQRGYVWDVKRKSLTAIELTRVKAKSFDKIKELSQHEIFTEALKESQINKYTNEDIVIKALVMLYCEKPSLKNDFVRPFIIETEITDSMAADVKKALTRIKYVHDRLVELGEVKVAKKLYIRTHLISLVPLAYANADIDKLVDFTKWFFTPEKRGVSISSVYNAHCSSGSNSQYAVEMRDRELRTYCEKFVGGMADEKQ